MALLLLVCGVDANLQKDNLWTPLHLASAHGHFKVSELLVKWGARIDVVN
jgi:ankyrin repeat protein